MSKKSSKSAYMAELRKAERQKQQKKQKQNAVIKKCAITLTAIIAVVLVAVLCVQLVNNSGITLGRYVVKGDNHVVTKGMMSYYIYEQYEVFLDYYGGSLSSMGFDTGKSLKKQTYTKGVSFFDYFAENAYANAVEYVYNCEAATAAEYDLTEPVKKALRERAETYDTEKYGRAVTVDDIYNALYLSTLASQYNSYVYTQNAPDNFDFDKHYDRNPNSCMRVDYLTYTIKFANNDAKDKENAREQAEAIGNAKTEEEFKQAVVSHYTDGKITDINSDDENAKKAIEEITKDNARFSNDELGNWLFNTADELETKVSLNSTKNTYTVTMLVTKPYLDTQKTVNVRHILIALDEFASSEEAKAEADRIYKELQDNGGKEDYFIYLATRYSSDTGSYFSGGLYSNVFKGQMVEEFEEWCFDETRKAGDTEIVLTSYGYHIMYFCGEGIETWKLDYHTSYSDQKYSELRQEFVANIHLDEKKNRISTLPERKK